MATVYLIDKDELESSIESAKSEIEDARLEVEKICRNALPTYEPCQNLRRLLGDGLYSDGGYVGWAIDAIKEKLTKHTFGPTPW
jgi:hypothetical protein